MKINTKEIIAKCRNGCKYYYTINMRLGDDKVSEECSADLELGASKGVIVLGYWTKKINFEGKTVNLPLHCPYRLEYLLKEEPKE